MKQFFLIVFFLIFTVLFSSCASTQKTSTETEVAGYNLKSKKEQMESKILHNRNKTLLAVQ